MSVEKREDCKWIECGCGILSMDGYCSDECPDYEQDPEIARDNDTEAIATKCRLKDPDYKRLYNIACDIIMNQHEERNKLKYDNRLMSELIKKGVIDG